MKSLSSLMPKPKLVQFPNAQRLLSGNGGNGDIIAEVMTITPQDATAWLKGNTKNRPTRKRHIEFLAREILSGNWQLNGQGIVIADNEQILDGQHRLYAIIEAGKSIQSLVIYGITSDAFRTMDTGAVRTAADALHLYFGEIQPGIIKAVSTAVQWCDRLERGFIHYRARISNTDVIDYVKGHPTLVQCAETLNSYPHEGRPMPMGPSTALYEMFYRKHQEQADRFMQRFFTGEGLVRTDPEYILRAAFIRDSERAAKYPAAIRLRMIIKGWNWLRRGNTEANRNTLAAQPNDEQKIRIF